MSKYIDAERLKIEIDRQKIGYNLDGKHAAEYETCVKIIRIIDALQREPIELNGVKYKEVPAKTNDKICKECDYFITNGCCTLEECPCSDDNILERISSEESEES